MGPLASSALLAVCCAALLACEKEASGDCQALCEHVSSLECSDPVDACVSDCEAYGAEVPAECQDEWQATLTCATKADWTCPARCDPSEQLCEESSPKIMGCDAENDALARCDSPDDCVISDAALTVIDEEGRVVDYFTTTLCDSCPAPTTGGGGDACADSADCEELCCDCPDLSLVANVCIDGVCAGATEGCDFACGTL